MKSNKTHIALFAGLGGFITACTRAGFDTVWANDADESCVATLRATFKGLTISCDDIKDISFPITSGRGQADLDDIEVDLLTAGFPCQSFSNAGGNKGFDDPRGQLFFEIPRLCSEMMNPPKVLVLENVPALQIFDGGSRLSVVLQGLRKAGYWVSASNTMILNSHELCGAPQDRSRLFIIAYHSKYFKKNSFIFNNSHKVVKDSIWDIVDRSQKKDKKYYLNEDNKYARKIRALVSENGQDRLYQVRRVEVRVIRDGICPTLTANMGGGGHNIPFVVDAFGIRALTETECLELQGFDPTEIIFPDETPRSARYSMIGNAIYPGVAEQIIKSIDFSRMKEAWL